MLETIRNLLGGSDESKEEQNDIPGVVVDEEASSPFKIADGGETEWEEVRTKTPSSGTREPARSDEEIEAGHRDNLEGVSEMARERLTFLVKNHNFRGMPTSKVRTKWGIEWLGNGSFRNVYGFEADSEIPLENPEDYVMKVAGKHEEWTNEEEVAAYSRLKGTEVEDYLAAVIDFGPEYEWVLMERADTEQTPTAEKVRNMKIECSDLGWSYHDWKPDNCGFVDDEPVLVDYGYHNQVGDKLK